MGDTEAEGSPASGQLPWTPEPRDSEWLLLLSLPSTALKGSCPVSRTWDPGARGSSFVPQSQFQWPLRSQPQVHKDLINGEDVGGAFSEPQGQGWPSGDRRGRDTLGKRFWEKEMVLENAA